MLFLMGHGERVGYNQKMDVLLHIHLLVGVPGLEPGKAGPESAVLPLHHTPIPLHQVAVFLIAGAKVRLFLESPKLFATFFQKIRKNIEKSL